MQHGLNRGQFPDAFIFFRRMMWGRMALIGLYLVLRIFPVVDQIPPPLSIFGVVFLVFPHPFVVVFDVVLFAFCYDLEEFLFG